MNNSLLRSIGLLSIVIGIGIFIGIVFYWLSFRTLERTPWLIISAFIIAIGVLLNIMLAWRLHLYFHTRSPRSGQFVLQTGMIGLFIVLVGLTLDLLSAILVVH
ncbi:MAG: hypothetical protein ABI904_01395 [Chloroflexota bacterium]